MRNAHSSPARWIQRGAWRLTPAWKSNAAPTPTSTGAWTRPTCAAIQRSCSRRAEPDPHDVGMRGRDRLGDHRVVGCVDGPERRTEGADDPGTRVSLGEVGLQALERVHGGTEQEVPPPRRLRAGEHGIHEIGAIDTLDRSAGGSPAPAEPHQRHAVGGHHPRIVVDQPKRGIVLALHHPVNAGDAHVVGVSPFDPIRDPIDRIAQRLRIDGDAEDVDPDRRHGGLPDRRLRTDVAGLGEAAPPSPTTRSRSGSTTGSLLAGIRGGRRPCRPQPRQRARHEPPAPAGGSGRRSGTYGRW